MYIDNSDENTRNVRCDEAEDEKCQHVERSAHEPSHHSAIENQEPEIRSVDAQGDVVVIVAHDRGTFRDSRRPYTLRWVHMFTFRGGRFARFRQICDSTAMLEA
jgi:ketosteroid isomerase-like protein